jgi:thiol peroxidase
MIERAGGVTSKGESLTVIGKQLAVGDKAPEFELLAVDMTTVKLSDSAGKVRLISVVPALDTSICDAQTRRFSEEIQKFGDNVIGYTISVDLPPTQKRWCGNAGVENVITLSDHRKMSFGDAYGTHIKELRQEQRAVFVVDGNDIVRYVEYVPKIGQHPDYEAALAAVQKIVG